MLITPRRSIAVAVIISCTVVSAVGKIQFGDHHEHLTAIVGDQGWSDENAPPSHAAGPRAGPTPPTFPAAFSSDITLNMINFVNGQRYLQPGRFYYDGERKLERMDITEDYHIKSVPNVTAVDYFFEDTAWFAIDGQCRNLVNRGRFFALFSWVKYAKFAGNVTASDGRTRCGLWELDAPSGHVALCATADGLPVYWTASNPKTPYITYNFTNVKVGSVPADTFALPAECSGPLTRCPGGKVETFEIYQAHPEGKFGLNNRNVADLLGDTMFLCFSSSAKKNSSSPNDDENEYVTIAGDVNNNNNHRPRLGVDGHGLVSLYEIEMFTGWGQYALCNGYPPTCWGRETKAVGREASYGVTGALGGQCGPAATIARMGTWLSLTAGGRCANASQPMGLGAGACTWRVKALRKTIEGKCLLNARARGFPHDFVESCTTEDLPLPKTTALFAAAFATNDTATGGCPAVGSMQ